MHESHEKRPDLIDWAVQERDREMHLRIRERDSGFVEEIFKALTRIETGTYGTCLLCEDEIGIERLMASPVTTLCIECQTRREALSKAKAHADGSGNGRRGECGTALEGYGFAELQRAISEAQEDAHLTRVQECRPPDRRKALAP